MRTFARYLASSANIGSSSALPGSSTPSGATVFTTFSSSAVFVEYGTGFAVHATFTGAQPQGTLALKGACLLPSQLATSSMNPGFVPIAGTSTYIGAGLPGSTAATGTSGQILWNVADNNYNYVRLTFDASTASTGNLSAIIVSKGWP